MMGAVMEKTPLGIVVRIFACETCGEQTEYVGTRLCDNCWEVERRLSRYALSPGGRAKLVAVLALPCSKAPAGGGT